MATVAELMWDHKGRASLAGGGLWLTNPQLLEKEAHPYRVYSPGKQYDNRGTNTGGESAVMLERQVVVGRKVPRRRWRWRRIKRTDPMGEENKFSVLV